nr:Gfo/Idh/MocA family oxidoreductase [Bacteriovorax sp. HI3]
MKKVLLIGYGSIGKRHAELFKSQSAKVGLVSSQTGTPFETFSNVKEAVENFSPDIVLITNETSKHFQSLTDLVAARFTESVFVEKPIFEEPVELDHHFKNIFVLYNLRMSPLLLSLKEKLKDQKIISANVYCGQYLPTWRPGRDYKETYSAKKELGGGVIRDLSHELDYTTWLTGRFEFVSALGGHFSNLEIASDDVFHLIGKCTNAASVNITVNYLDRSPTRKIIINTNDHTYNLDLIKGELIEDSTVILTGVKAVNTYLSQVENILNNTFENFCTYEHAMNTLLLIKAAESSSAEGKVIKL